MLQHTLTMLTLNHLLLHSLGPKEYQVLPHTCVVKPCLFFPPTLVYSVTGDTAPATSVLQHREVNQELPSKQQP